MDKSTILLLFSLSNLSFISIFLLMTPVHEAVHWVLFSIEPDAEPLEYHAFDYNSFKRGYLGYVSWDGKMRIFNSFSQELIANTIQLLVAIPISYLITMFLLKRVVK